MNIEVETKAGWKIKAAVSPCKYCPENSECPINNFLSLLKDSTVINEDELKTFAHEAKLINPFSYTDGSETGGGRHLVYNCDNLEARDAVRGSISLNLSPSESPSENQF